MGDNTDRQDAPHTTSRERNLSIVAYSLFSAWMLAFLFEGQILYSLADSYGTDPSRMVSGGVAAVLVGLLSCGTLVKTKRAAKRLFVGSFLIFAVDSAVFFFPPSTLWATVVIADSFLAGCCVAAWAFYLRSVAPKHDRFKAIADMLLLSNVLMVLLNMVDAFVSSRLALALSMFALLCAFVLTRELPGEAGSTPNAAVARQGGHANITGLLIFFCLFVAIMSITSGLMYRVVNPAFAHLKWLVSWYWAAPYIASILVIRNLPRQVDHTYILYTAIGMIGLSFIGFMGLGRSAVSYLVIDALMLGACGVYDLFWWGILGEMLEFHDNPPVILGTGLAANVLGILSGGLIGNAIMSSGGESANPSLLALTVVCVTLALLPPLHKHLSSLLEGRDCLAALPEINPKEEAGETETETKRVTRFAGLSERESQVAFLLLQGKTYKRIAAELNISQNTVKYYVKNIYSKLNIQSRSELIDIALKK